MNLYSCVDLYDLMDDAVPLNGRFIDTWRVEDGLHLWDSISEDTDYSLVASAQILKLRPELPWDA